MREEIITSFPSVLMTTFFDRIYCIMERSQIHVLHPSFAITSFNGTD